MLGNGDRLGGVSHLYTRFRDIPLHAPQSGDRRWKVFLDGSTLRNPISGIEYFRLQGLGIWSVPRIPVPGDSGGSTAKSLPCSRCPRGACDVPHTTLEALIHKLSLVRNATSATRQFGSPWCFLALTGTRHAEGFSTHAAWLGPAADFVTS